MKIMNLESSYLLPEPVDLELTWQKQELLSFMILIGIRKMIYKLLLEHTELVRFLKLKFLDL